jgi:hypothetical protein
MALRGAAVSLCFALAAGSAAAEGWTIKDLGGIPTEAACVDLAWDVFARYRGARSVGDLQRSGWIVYGYDLSSDDYDGVITCGYGPDGTTRATLAVYSAGDAGTEMRREIADRLERYWGQMK